MILGALSLVLAATPPLVTSFDPWSGIELGGGATFDGSAFSGRAHGAWRLHGDRESQSKAESSWLLLHRVASVELYDAHAAPVLEAQAYSGLFRRHVREGVIVLPFATPVRIPFPLDLSFKVDLARVEKRWSEGADWSLEPLRFALLFDPLRQPTSRFHLALGPTVAWKLRSLGGVITHDVMPFTAATLFLDLESDDGLWVARGNVSAGWAMQLPGLSLTPVVRGELQLSRVLFSLNDAPFAVFLRGGGAWRDLGANDTSGWWASTGLEVRLFGK